MFSYLLLRCSAAAKRRRINRLAVMNATWPSVPAFSPSRGCSSGRSRRVFKAASEESSLSAFRIDCAETRKEKQNQLIVVGGGAAGMYGAITAKTSAPDLNVIVLEKGHLLSKVKISGGGRCNVTNGHCADHMILADHYPRGHEELRGSFFRVHGPEDTMHWFSDHGVKIKIEDDGRAFPSTDSSSSIVDCLLSEAQKRGIILRTRRTVNGVTKHNGGIFLLEARNQDSASVERIEADYVLVASGSSKKGYAIAKGLGHSIIDPVPSLFSFKIADPDLLELSGVTFSRVKATLQLGNHHHRHLTQVGPLLITHWGLSGPVILRISAWGTRQLIEFGYRGNLIVDFLPDIHVENARSIILSKKSRFARHKLQNVCPEEFRIVKRFWIYVLRRQGLDCDCLWATVSKKSLVAAVSLLKNFPFEIAGKGPFNDEFVVAGGVPLSEISLNTMESKLHPNLFFAGEILNVDGETGGFNLQNAWTGGYISGTAIATREVSN